MIPTKLNKVDKEKQTQDSDQTVLFTITNNYMKKAI